MVTVLNVVAVMLVGLAAALAVAHALEMPGKLRLDREHYFEVQQIYYPGFTIGGAVAEPGGTLAVLILLFLVPAGSAAFWLALVALAGMVAVMAVFWLVTQPVNKVWTEGLDMGALGAGFFHTGAGDKPAADWRALRDRWEWSHVARAGLATASFVCLVVALAI